MSLHIARAEKPHKVMTRKQFDRKVLSLFTAKELKALENDSIYYIGETLEEKARDHVRSFSGNLFGFYTAIVNNWTVRPVRCESRGRYVFEYLGIAPAKKAHISAKYKVAYAAKKAEPFVNKVWPGNDLLALKFGFTIQNRTRNDWKYALRLNYGCGLIGGQFFKVFQEITGLQCQMTY